MMRLPYFKYHSPKSASEAASILSDSPAETMLVAGGTDVLPNMKRRQQTPKVLVGLRNIKELRISTNGSGVSLGAGMNLTQIVRDQNVRMQYSALWQAVAQIATPQLRNMGTIGGNLCLDTRCNYYDQNYEWRKAINFCIKKDGDICWVATSSPKCLAVSSTDSAPALIVLNASVLLVSKSGERDVKVEDLYQNDGIHYTTRRPDELLTNILLPPSDGWKSCYWKLRRRGSFDFPVLGVAAALKLDGNANVTGARIVLGAVASRPLVSLKAAEFLIGKKLDDATLSRAADIASELAKPMDNTDFMLGWRKRMAREFVIYALRDLRGENLRDVRYKYAKQSLDCVY
ncbi:MAG: FAD binding domain-containing protein [Planctomycetota bacterium]